MKFLACQGMSAFLIVTWFVSPFSGWAKESVEPNKASVQGAPAQSRGNHKHAVVQHPTTGAAPTPSKVAAVKEVQNHSPRRSAAARTRGGAVGHKDSGRIRAAVGQKEEDVSVVFPRYLIRSTGQSHFSLEQPDYAVISKPSTYLDRNHDGVVDPMEQALSRMKMTTVGDIGLRGADMALEHMRQRERTASSLSQPKTAPALATAPVVAPRSQPVKQKPPRRKLSVVRSPHS